MRPLRTGLFGLLVNFGAQEASPFVSFGAGALAQTRSDPVASRFGRWTRARFQAAKKHWAEHEQWFSECNKELDTTKKSNKRMSYDRQADFLEQCMRRKH
jgi:hypothetical protein